MYQETERLPFLEGVDLATSWLAEPEPGLPEVSELLFSPDRLLPDHSLLKSFLGLKIPPFLLPLPLSSLLLTTSTSLMEVKFPLRDLSSSGPVSQSSSVLVVADLELPWDPVFSNGSKAWILSGRSGPLELPDDWADLACSKKRTCTTTRKGSRSFCAACMHASGDNFLQSISLHILFFSPLLSPGCSCTKITKTYMR